MKKYLITTLCLLTMLAGFTSCQDDEDIYDRIVGRTWIGDLGFYDGPDDLQSGVYFGSDGFGTDELCYYDNGQFFSELKMQWDVRGGDIYISYGKVAAPRELRAVYVNKRSLTGTLYVDGVNLGEVTLELD